MIVIRMGFVATGIQILYNCCVCYREIVFGEHNKHNVKSVRKIGK